RPDRSETCVLSTRFSYPRTTTNPPFFGGRASPSGANIAAKSALASKNPRFAHAPQPHKNDSQYQTFAPIISLNFLSLEEPSWPACRGRGRGRREPLDRRPSDARLGGPSCPRNTIAPPSWPRAASLPLESRFRSSICSLA